VERGDPHLLRLVLANELGGAFAHFGGGLVGKGDGQDFMRARTPRCQQVRNSMGQHTRLARAGTGDDQQRAPCIAHGLFLLRVHAYQQFVRGRQSPR